MSPALANAGIPVLLVFLVLLVVLLLTLMLVGVGCSPEPDARNRWRRVRWCLAGLIILGVLIANVASLAGSIHLACEVTKVTRSGSTSVTTTTTCGVPDITDYAPELAVVLLLLVPWSEVNLFEAFGIKVERAIQDARIFTAAGPASTTNVAKTAQTAKEIAEGG